MPLFLPPLGKFALGMALFSASLRYHAVSGDDRMLDVILALMPITATLGPILTQHFAARMRADVFVKEARNP